MTEGRERFLKLVPEVGSGGDLQPDRGLRMLFPDPFLAPWLRACRRLEEAGYGEAVVRAYERQGIECARALGPEAAIDLVDVVSAVAIKSGRKTAEALPEAAALAARKAAAQSPGDRAAALRSYRTWLSLMQRFAASAPESAWVVLQRMETLLATLNLAGLEAWLLAGVRIGGGDPERRHAFFSLENPEAARWLQREAGDVVFADVEGRMKPFLTALFGIRLPILEPPASAPEPSRRRASFGRGLIRLPQSFPGYRGAIAEDLFRAALAHIGAHLHHGGPPMPLGQLKPLQVALVSLIEDARVERLALRALPGLRRLWLPFHIAQASGAETAPSLFARLSRALIDPDFQDANGWVAKGRALFEAGQARLEDPSLSREIGNLLGNDLGQMRVQFNAKTYIVEPPYRDDNLGLWDLEDQPGEPEAVELPMEALRLQRPEEPDQEPDREREEEEQDGQAPESVPRARASETEGALPVARYPEFDYQLGRERAEWVTVTELDPRMGPAGRIERLLEDKAGLAQRISRLVRAARVSRARRLRRQAEGEALDLDAVIEAAVSLRSGETPDTRVYQRMERRQRDLAVQLLLDCSQSSADLPPGQSSSVLELECEAAALLAHAMDGLGDPFALAAFSSNGREEVRYTRIKDFGAAFDAPARARLAGLAPGYSTRLGAALRHAGRNLEGQRSYRRLLLILTDGEPSDVDCPDPLYLIQDARRAVQSLAARGLDVFCIALGQENEEPLQRIFGRRSLLRIDRIERLPERLPLLYLRLTS